MKISNIRSNEREKRREIIKEKVKNLSEEEKQSLEQEFEALLEKENNSMTEEFRKLRWKGMFISAYFEGFVEEKIYAELFKKEDEIHDEKIVQSSGLLGLLEKVCDELAREKQKKKNLECESKILEPKALGLSTQESEVQEPCSSQNLKNSASYTQNMTPSMRIQNVFGGCVQEDASWA